MKHKLYVLSILSALVISLAVFFISPADPGKADTAYAQAASCANGCLALKQASMVPVVISIVRSSSNPTDAEWVDFTVTFSEPVKGVDKGDFAPVVQGVEYAFVADVFGFGSTYIVTVYTGFGDGSLGLSVVDYDLISNVAGETLGGIGSHNGDFTGGEAYTIVR